MIETFISLEKKRFLSAPWVAAEVERAAQEEEGRCCEREWEEEEEKLGQVKSEMKDLSWSLR